MSSTLRSLALALLATGATSLSAQVDQRTLRGNAVAIYNLAGRVRAEAGPGDAVTVEISRMGRDRDRLRVETGTLQGRETLRIVYPADRIVYPALRDRSRISTSVREDGTFSDGGWNDRDGRERVEIRSDGSGLEAHADLVVRVPKGQRIELYLAAGQVDVVNVEGNVLLDVGAANVDVSGVRGQLLLDTGSGRVAVRDVTGNVNVDAGSGGLSMERVKGDVLRIDSGSGGVRVSDVDVRELSADVGAGGMRLYRVKAALVTAETGSGGVELELLTAPEQLSVETGSGGATIRAPATLSAEIVAETGSGGFTTDFAITTRRVGRNHVMGRIGDGRGRIRIEAGSGSIRLLKN